MTREELNKLIMQACERTWNEKTCKEIEQALSHKPCTDAVSRDAVLDETIRKNSIWNSITNSEGKNLEEIIFELPSVTQKSEHFIDGVHAMGYREGYKDAQKQKSGKWLITPMSNIAYCSECDYLFKDIPASIVEQFKYCPNCGYRMESEGKE